MFFEKLCVYKLEHGQLRAFILMGFNVLHSLALSVIRSSAAEYRNTCRAVTRAGGLGALTWYSRSSHAFLLPTYDLLFQLPTTGFATPIAWSVCSISFGQDRSSIRLNHDQAKEPGREGLPKTYE